MSKSEAVGYAIARKKKKQKQTVKVTCDYCGKPAKLIDSALLYGMSYGMVWSCDPCGAYVGCHKNSKNHIPLGRLANPELRMWKRKAHAYFDPLWQRKMEMQGCAKNVARQAGYKWLSKMLNIPAEKCHIGMFDVETCRKVVEVCSEYGVKKRIYAKDNGE